MITLFPYQGTLKSAIKGGWAIGHTNVLAVLPTGGGKTIVFGSIIHDHPGASVSIAHRQELVGQISMALAREGVKHRIIAPDNVRVEIIRQHTRELGKSWEDATARAAVAGVDTLLNRAKKKDPAFQTWLKSVTLWVTDECHHILDVNKWGRACALFPNAKGLGVTATPERADGMGLGRHADGVFDVMVEGPTMRWLIDNGYLTDYRIFAPPSDLIVEGDVAPSGDWSPQKLKAASKKSHIIGDVVKHYLRIAPDKMGVVFTTDIETAEDIADSFVAAGIVAAAVSSKTKSKERNFLIAEFRAGRIQVLVNVDLFGEGFDLPAIEVVVFARPTMSYGLYVQQFGRALRILLGKTHAIIIDHVGNTHWSRHGLPDADRVWSLDRRDRRAKKPRDTDLIPTRACTTCTALYEAIHSHCPWCGAEHFPALRTGPQHVDGDLLELDQATLAAMRQGKALVDQDPIEFHQEAMARYGVKLANMHTAKHREGQEAQKPLREVIALWAGYQRDMGRPKSEAYKRFYFKFGVDVATAMTLKTREAKTLSTTIAMDLCAL